MYHSFYKRILWKNLLHKPNEKVEDEADNSRISIFPNPSIGIFNLEGVLNKATVMELHKCNYITSF